MLQSGRTYHIYNHANGWEDLFREEKNYGFFMEKYRKYIPPVADTFSWALMPNHFHLMLRIKTEGEIIDYFNSPDLQGFLNLEGLAEDPAKLERFITQQFSNFFNSYCKAFNKTYNRMGSLFMMNFRYKPVTSQAQLLQTLVYLHYNPGKHGFAKQLGEWPWTSYQMHFDITAEYPFISSKIADIFADHRHYTEMHSYRPHYNRPERF